MSAEPIALAGRKCQSCAGLTDPISQEEIERLLKQVSPEWQLEENSHHLERHIVFRDLDEAMRFLNRVVEVANEEDHHPDFTLWAWNRVKLVEFTYAVDGLTDNDFIIAAKIDELIDSGEFKLKE